VSSGGSLEALMVGLDASNREVRRDWQRRLTVWRSHHDLEMHEVIRTIRSQEDRSGYGSGVVT
jgi:hypothetical protein